jgi:DNA-binding transcriptional LysR family regulator
MTLNVRQIEVFRAIMVSGSISGAARMLAISQPAISRMLAYMEDRLQLKLFERRAGRVIATPEAHQIFDEVDKVYQHVQRVNQVAEELRFKGIDHIRVACSPSLGQSVMPLAIKMFGERFGDVRVEMEILGRTELIDRISTGRVHFGASVLPVDDTTVSSQPVATGRLVVICPSGHRFSSMSSIRTQDLGGEHLIGFGAHTPYGNLLHEFIPDCPPASTIVRFVPNACSLVRVGVGVAIVDEFALSRDFSEKIAIRPLEPEVSITVHELTSRLTTLSSAGEWFRTCFRRCASLALAK